MPNTFYDKYELIDALVAANASKIALKILDEPLTYNGFLHSFRKINLYDYKTEDDAAIDARRTCVGEFGIRGDLSGREYLDGLQEIFSILKCNDTLYVRICW